MLYLVVITVTASKLIYNLHKFLSYYTFNIETNTKPKKSRKIAIDTFLDLENPKSLNKPSKFHHDDDEFSVHSLGSLSTAKYSKHSLETYNPNRSSSIIHRVISTVGLKNAVLIAANVFFNIFYILFIIIMLKIIYF